MLLPGQIRGGKKREKCARSAPLMEERKEKKKFSAFHRIRVLEPGEADPYLCEQGTHLMVFKATLAQEQAVDMIEGLTYLLTE